VIEPRLAYKVVPDKLSNKKIGAIDGGLSQHSYHGLDMILLRAVSVIFNYSDGKLQKVDYYPATLTTPKLILISDPYSDQEFSISSSLERQKEEIELAAKVIKQFSPDLLLLDGPVMPHIADRPNKSSQAFKSYEKVLASFKKLYNSKGLFAGCIEDSRARALCKIIAEQILSKIKSPMTNELEKILAKTRDTNLLFYVLEKGERTCIFKSKSSVLEDLKEDRIYSFYFKTAEYDRPVRIDFFAESDPIAKAEQIAPLILATCWHSSYGFPAPLTEADYRAKLQEQDVESLHDQLVDRVGITPSVMKLRREQRPF